MNEVALAERARIVGKRFRVLAEPDDTLENTPDDVRIYVECDGESVILDQGPDRIVVGVEEWERFASEVMGAVLAARRGDTDGD